jgi:ribosomal protein S25
MPSTVDDSRRALEAELTLRLLDDVEGERVVSQRSLAVRLGIAVGLANAYLRR